MKSFIPYNSSSQECRINGLASWFVKNKIQDQDEIVIQFLDENEGIYRLIKETKFIEQIKTLESKIVSTKKDDDLEKYFEDLALKVNQSKKEVAIVEFLRLNNEIIKRRSYKKIKYLSGKRECSCIAKKNFRIDLSREMSSL